MTKSVVRPFALTLLTAMIVASGCDNRGTNIPVLPEFDNGGPWTVANHVFSPQLRFQFENDLELLPMWIYIPEVAWDPPRGISKPVPVLVLLAPQFADQFYYAHHGLEILLKEMIANHTIQPMVVVCLPSNNTFGGYFYAGGKNFSNLPRPPSGNYDEIVGDQLLAFLRNFLHVINAKQKTGIGGIGMGAYGAFRAALLHSSAFGSISITDGPVDFDGNPGQGFGNGLIDLFDDALNEQGLLGGNIKNFDSSKANPISNMFIGGAYAFSPHDTLLYDNVIYPPGQNPIKRVDSSLTITDSTTLITGFFGPGGQWRFNYHLPFTSDGQPDILIWPNFWLTENLENLLDSSTNKLNGVNIWIATSTETRYNFHQQTESWIYTLTNPPYNYPVTVRNYEGVPGQPATSDQYLYDLLKEMLIFHSESFGS